MANRFVLRWLESKLLADCCISYAVNMHWSSPVVLGQPPTPRDNHSCTTVGQNMFVFGGTDGIRQLNNLHIFKTCTLILFVSLCVNSRVKVLDILLFIFPFYSSMSIYKLTVFAHYRLQ